MKTKILVALVMTVVLSVQVAMVGCTNYAKPSPTPTRARYLQTVEDFIRNSTTFKFDGMPGNITFTNMVGSIEAASSAEVKDWEFTVEYQTAHAGHGDRTKQITVQG